MSNVTDIRDKQEQQAAREWFRLLREEGVAEMEAEMTAHSQRRRRLRANQQDERGRE